MGHCRWDWGGGRGGDERLDGRRGERGREEEGAQELAEGAPDRLVETAEDEGEEVARVDAVPAGNHGPGQLIRTLGSAGRTNSAEVMKVICVLWKPGFLPGLVTRL